MDYFNRNCANKKIRCISIITHNRKLFLLACDISEFTFQFKIIKALSYTFTAATWIRVT